MAHSWRETGFESMPLGVYVYNIHTRAHVLLSILVHVEKLISISIILLYALFYPFLHTSMMYVHSICPKGEKVNNYYVTCHEKRITCDKTIFSTAKEV